ncbi:MAG TPA: hypothetical protein VFJ02_00995 [Vicinamibacterales bacterium]|nr:hypothetical protein [Vicinamibacterales bacterium]
MRPRMLLTTGAMIWAASTAAVVLARADRATSPPQPAAGRGNAAAAPHFQTSDNCLACHNSLATSSGEDISIGSSWRGTIMANSSRDPYWQASVRREVLDHPSRQADIEDECSVCHMPMARTVAKAAGRLGQVFAHLTSTDDISRLAADGVSCTMCHQIGRDRLGTEASFSGGFVVNPPGPDGSAIFGPFKVDAGRTRLMHSAAGMTPVESTHIQQSELCATCHTLYTDALGADGQVVGRLPEQVPFLEWRHSAYRSERSCQGCHMPEVAEPARISSVLGEPRPGVSRHTFVGGNAFMLRMLDKFRDDLRVEALPAELDAMARATIRQLQSTTADVTLSASRDNPRELTLTASVRNLSGHKFPTGYPARRAWLHLVVRDRDGRVVFESGKVAPTGAIEGNDADAVSGQYEPHYTEIRRGDQVQIYESVMQNASGAATTRLLQALRFVKDNRLLPRGFDKAAAGPDIAVRGTAAGDQDFTDGGDRVRYVVDVGGAVGPFTATVELLYQPIAYRWAQNLKAYQGDEPRRFVSYYDALAAQSATVVTTARVEGQ